MHLFFRKSIDLYDYMDMFFSFLFSLIPDADSQFLASISMNTSKQNAIM